MREACQRYGFEHTVLPVTDEYDLPLRTYLRRRMDLFR